MCKTSIYAWFIALLILPTTLEVAEAQPVPGYGYGHGRCAQESSCASRRHGHGRGDHDRARDAVSRGEAVPLSVILAEVGREVPGRFLEAELKETERGLRYKVDVLSPEGSLIELVYDARTGVLLKRRDGHRRWDGLEE